MYNVTMSINALMILKISVKSEWVRVNPGTRPRGRKPLNEKTSKRLMQRIVTRVSL